MTPSITAFVDELYLIKIGERKPLAKEEWKQLAKNVGAMGIGSFIGGGSGYAARKKLLPKLLPYLGPKSRTAVGVGGGALVGLLSAGAIKHHLRTLDDSGKRND